MRKVEKLKLTCKKCGTVFEKYACQISRRENDGSFCSRECFAAYHRKGKRFSCDLCGKVFYRNRAEIERGRRKGTKNIFCSKRCYFDWRKIYMKGSTYPKDGQVHIHRIVAEAKLGRKLKPEEVVHHIDGNKHNNHPDNILILKDQAEHARLHAIERKLEDTCTT